MRQIVQLSKPIVQNATHASANDGAQRMAGLAGKADVYAWDGAEKTIEWQLTEGLGYLLVTSGDLAATCATGKQTQLHRGDLLIMNEANSRSFTMALKGSKSGNNATSTQDASGVIYGSMRANSFTDTAAWRPQPFAQAPTWAMAVVQPTPAECTRLSSLAQLLLSEAAANHHANGVVAGLQATLFEALSVTLRAHDPLSMPQVTAGIDSHLSRALTAMAIAPAKAWRVETMAHEAAMSRTAFAVRFKAVMRKTPLDYLTTLRIQHAVTQFANHPSRSVDAVAREVGYADESALRRAYRRVTGEALKMR